MTLQFQHFNRRPHPAVPAWDKIRSLLNGILGKKKKEAPASAIYRPVEGAANPHIHGKAPVVTPIFIAMEILN